METVLLLRRQPGAPSTWLQWGVGGGVLVARPPAAESEIQRRGRVAGRHHAGGGTGSTAVITQVLQFTENYEGHEIGTIPPIHSFYPPEMGVIRSILQKGQLRL